MRRIIFKLILLLVIFLFQPFQQAYGQEDELIVLSNESIVNYPETVTFQLEIDAGQQLAEATLIYHLGQNNCLEAGTQVPVEVNGSTLEWTWVMSRSGNPPPGAVLWWQWRVIDIAGHEITTPKEMLTFSDDRFEWRTVSAGDDSPTTPIVLHWYEGDDVGPILLDAAVAGLHRLEQDTGIQLLGQVQFFIYGSTEDMREAMIYIQDWAGGIAFSEYNTILIGVPPRLADSWGSETVRHELAHLVIGQYAQSCLGGSLPNWLSEGLSVYAEGEPGADTLSDISDGIQKNSFQPVRSLNGSFPAQDDEARAAYSQSYSLVNYLLDLHGQEKIQDLLQSLASGIGYDAALEAVYGFNADGLELLWRQHIGAPARSIPATLTPLSPDSIPTTMPLNAAWNQPTATSEIESSSGEPDRQIATPPTKNEPGSCLLGLMPLMLLVGLGVIAPVFQKKGHRKP